MRGWHLHHDQQISRRADLAAAQALYERDPSLPAAGVTQRSRVSHDTHQRRHQLQSHLGHPSFLQRPALSNTAAANMHGRSSGQRSIPWGCQQTAAAPSGSYCGRPLQIPFLPQVSQTQGLWPAAHQQQAGQACCGLRTGAWDLQCSHASDAPLHPHDTFQGQPSAGCDISWQGLAAGMQPEQGGRHGVSTKQSRLLQRLADLKVAADAALQGSCLA